MNDKFDELAKGLAQSVTRRGALKKFGLGLVGVMLTALGLANKGEAGPKRNSLHVILRSQDSSSRVPAGRQFAQKRSFIVSELALLNAAKAQSTARANSTKP